MKKALIAGAASVALAAMPVVGVFATDWTDQFTLSINDSCTIIRKTDEAHGTGETWTTDSQDTTKDTFAIGQVYNGETKNNFASSNFTASCNKDNGYSLTVATQGFTRNTSPSGVDTWAYNAGGLASTGSSWTLAATGDVVSQDLTNNIITSTSRSTVDDINITYSLKVGDTQQPGTYNASAAYTLTAK
ncbi:hypothetical protein IKE13_02455 [Candidatus Saccharibacteria bacterium]|nr:hypothetical protein [Candidatus Saccharibacteria bacterium]